MEKDLKLQRIVRKTKQIIKFRQIKLKLRNKTLNRT